MQPLAKRVVTIGLGKPGDKRPNLLIRIRLRELCLFIWCVRCQAGEKLTIATLKASRDFNFENRLVSRRTLTGRD